MVYILGCHPAKDHPRNTGKHYWWCTFLDVIQRKITLETQVNVNNNTYVPEHPPAKDHHPVVSHSTVPGRHHQTTILTAHIEKEIFPLLLNMYWWDQPVLWLCSTLGHRQSDEHWNHFKGNIGEPLRDGVEHIWAFLSAQIPSWTELNCSIIQQPRKSFRFHTSEKELMQFLVSTMHQKNVQLKKVAKQRRPNKKSYSQLC